jgi:hypothetical protein
MLLQWDPLVPVCITLGWLIECGRCFWHLLIVGIFDKLVVCYCPPQWGCWVLYVWENGESHSMYAASIIRWSHQTNVLVSDNLLLKIISCGEEIWISQGKEMLILRCEIGSFSDCSKSGSTYESCFPYTDVCIWRGLFNDSYVNCPLGCFDEEQCYRPPPGKLSEVGVIVVFGIGFTHFITLLWFVNMWCLLVLKFWIVLILCHPHQ